SDNSPSTEGTTDRAESLLKPTAESTDNRRQHQQQQQQQQSAQSVTTAASSLTPSPFPEKDIKEIVKKGFTREQAIEELKSTDGDVTKALVTLITKSLTIYKRKD
ncbi:unnamed protein product, partial [Rotaria socialis]